MSTTKYPFAGATNSTPVATTQPTASVVEVSFLGRCTFDGNDVVEIKLYRVARRGKEEVKAHCGNLTFYSGHAHDFVASMKNLKLIDHATGEAFQLPAAAEGDVPLED